MGKSINGAVWVNEEMLSPYDYFQFWRNIEDLDVVRFALLYSEWSDEEMESFEQLSAQNINNAKKDLAYRLTTLCHGEEAAKNAMETARRVFEEGGIGGELPVHLVIEDDLQTGITACELIFTSGLSESKSEARKLIRGGGARLNDNKIEDENMLITSAHLINDGAIKLSAGKKKHILVRVGS